MVRGKFHCLAVVCDRCASVNLHISGLERLGATIKLEEGYVKAWSMVVKGAYVMDQVRASRNGDHDVCCTTLAEGAPIIENAAREPEIINTANFLKPLGQN
ncbi:hypothetical protein ACNKHU_19705 [Shigella flexneri]